MNISVRKVVNTTLIGLLRGYRLVISPLFPPCCRYYPSCSAYALQAIRMHGPIPGGWLALKRLSKCHPWSPGGYDPVPPLAAKEPSAGEREGIPLARKEPSAGEREGTLLAVKSTGGRLS